jgi:hypothetical protein
MRKDRAFFIGMNFIAPGVGQIAAGCYFRGALLLLGSLAMVVWAVWEIIRPVYRALDGELSSGGAGPSIDILLSVNYMNLGCALLFFLMIWAWSVADIALFYRAKPDREKPNETL